MKATAPKTLRDKTSRIIARRERDSQWEFMERVAREGIVWMCPWDRYRKHGRRCFNRWCESKTFVPFAFDAHRNGFQCAHCKVTMERIPDDGVYVFGLIGSNEFYHWLDSHKNWWKRGRWSEKRCARSIRITADGIKALENRELHDMEPIFGGMVEPGYVVVPWPKKKAA